MGTLYPTTPTLMSLALEKWGIRLARFKKPANGMPLGGESSAKRRPTQSELAFFFLVAAVDEARFLIFARAVLREAGRTTLRGTKGFTKASSKLKTFLKSFGESVSFLPSTPL